MECCSDEVESKLGHRELTGRSNGAGADDRRERREDVSASVEMVKRRRGRPPGSKNKPKPPRAAVVAPQVAAALTPPSFPSLPGGMRAHILEIPAGHDVAAALAAFSGHHGVGICVLGGNGAVADVSLRQPSPSGSSTIVLRGRFDVLSVSATFLPPTLSAAVAGAGANELKVCLSGQQGQVLGGTVTGPLVAAEPLVIVVAAFSDPTVHQLPMEQEESSGGGIDSCAATAEAVQRQDEEDEEEENVDVDEAPASEHQQYQPDNYFYDHHPNGSAPGGLSIYGAHFASDVLWQTSHHPTSPPY